MATKCFCCHSIALSDPSRLASEVVHLTLNYVAQSLRLPIVVCMYLRNTSSSSTQWRWLDDWTLNTSQSRGGDQLIQKRTHRIITLLPSSQHCNVLHCRHSAQCITDTVQFTLHKYNVCVQSMRHKHINKQKRHGQRQRIFLWAGIKMHFSTPP